MSYSLHRSLSMSLEVTSLNIMSDILILILLVLIEEPLKEVVYRVPIDDRDYVLATEKGFLNPGEFLPEAFLRSSAILVGRNVLYLISSC